MPTAQTWTIRCRAHELVVRYGRPSIAGILNVTPDSFYDGGLYTTRDRARLQADTLFDGGAAIIDIGGASSRPRGRAYGEGAAAVPPDLELARVLPVVTDLATYLPDAVLSVDTFHASVADACLGAGAHMINDITALRYDEKMADVVASHQAAIVLMHSIGMPGEMPHVADEDDDDRQSDSDWQSDSNRRGDGDRRGGSDRRGRGDIVGRVHEELSEAVERARAAGIRDIVTDPGFGFGKSVADNFRLIDRLEDHRVDDLPIMIGVSRKSSIGVVLGEPGFPAPAHNRLFGSLGVTAVGVLRGAAIIRTHDAAVTNEMLRTLSYTLMPSSPTHA